MFITFLSYVAVYFLGALSIILAAAYYMWQEQKKKELARKAAHVKEQLDKIDNMRPKPILT